MLSDEKLQLVSQTQILTNPHLVIDLKSCQHKYDGVVGFVVTTNLTKLDNFVEGGRYANKVGVLNNLANPSPSIISRQRINLHIDRTQQYQEDSLGDKCQMD